MRLLWVILLVLAGSQGAAAHTRSQSASDWRIEGNQLQATFSIDSRRATLLYGQADVDDVPLSDLVGAHLGRTIIVTQGGTPCIAASPPAVLPAAEGFERFGMSFECPEQISGSRTLITVGAFFEYSAGHLHIIRIQSDGELILERVLTGSSNRVQVIELADEINPLAQVKNFVAVGTRHVLSGWDHLAFLAALLLLAGRLKPVVLTITGFTVGHSLTMALVALGLLRPQASAIEILIGFSIAYAAMEAARLPPKQRLAVWLLVGMTGMAVALGALGFGQAWPPVLAFVGVCFFALSQSVKSETSGWTWRAPLLAAMFGLAHGAGFAGALLDYNLGGSGLIWALLGFNVGVEIGQLAAVLTILALVFGASRMARRDVSGLRSPAAAVLFGLGVFWTVARILPV